jgi:flagellum-specific peptidoglycan hydrolase FlgJ
MSKFTAEAIAAAQDAQRRWNIFASVSLAQWALESNYGAAQPSGSNNPFGIKAVDGQPFVYAWTHETIDGRYVKVIQKFGCYQNLEAAFEAHARLLATSRYYVKAQHADNPKTFARDLNGIYATGIPGHPYDDALIAIMDGADLYQYDLTSAQAKRETPPDLSTVKGIQTKLNVVAKAGLDVDGEYGPATYEAVLNFQRAHPPLAVDGIVGTDTLKALALEA